MDDEHDTDPENLEPRFSRFDEPPVKPQVVLSGYANLVRWINRQNESLPALERACVPYGVQEALCRYIVARGFSTPDEIEAYLKGETS